MYGYEDLYWKTWRVKFFFIVLRFGSSYKHDFIAPFTTFVILCVEEEVMKLFIYI